MGLGETKLALKRSRISNWQMRTKRMWHVTCGRGHVSPLPTRKKRRAETARGHASSCPLPISTSRSYQNAGGGPADRPDSLLTPALRARPHQQWHEAPRRPYGSLKLLSSTPLQPWMVSGSPPKQHPPPGSTEPSRNKRKPSGVEVHHRGPGSTRGTASTRYGPPKDHRWDTASVR